MSSEQQSYSTNGLAQLICNIFILIYIFSYSLLSIWLLFDGWINQFSSLHWMWGINEGNGFSNAILLVLFSLLGAILGGAILSITSFHRYVAIEKNFDLDHIWGFIYTPILSSIVGITVFALVQSGLLVLNGSFAEGEQSISATMGFTAIGCISGYNWDVIIAKLQELSKGIFKKE
ncbi:hypothetical protein NBRC116592_06250 [Colwellia sp. KU-HH00111]|uniref:hypothetical protein n=1 Tax=Colwellia sp. KU-HH00111 TaxID=3127652 RepID=UPI00310A39B9